ncbi:MAG: DUF692 family protein [Nitrospira sp.]|nr:DUF692 family protein [Nitrospira sp.]
MAALNVVEQAFLRRLELIQVHGLGLSVDVYSPDLPGLLGALRRRQVRPAYLEVFRAAPAALAMVRSQAGDGLLTYHGEGLWLTQPDLADDPVFPQEVYEVAGHLQTLDSAWLNHECATKSIAGYSFGTYLPPLYTESSAAMVAENTRLVQALLDRHCRLSHGGAPLVLLEMPPLTYFIAGTIDVPMFFQLVVRSTPCGLVLDVGHLWTVYRYSGAWQAVSLAQFVKTFLDNFPMQRVVEIHVAGLAPHESSPAAQPKLSKRTGDGFLPAWTDAHAAPIPPVLFEMLDQIMSHPGLTSLRGLALEVDTKPIELIVEEFVRFAERYRMVPFPETVLPVASDDQVTWLPEEKRLPGAVVRRLEEAYDRYARVAVGRADPVGTEWTHPTACADELDRYRSSYLPYEILHWGGDVESMFPESCRRLAGHGVPLSRFVPFWFSRSRLRSPSYDFFLVKIERFIEFVQEEASELSGIAQQEADELRGAYEVANAPPIQTMSEHS